MSSTSWRARARDRWLDVLIGLVCVLLAGALTLAIDEEEHFTQRRTTVGVPLEVSASGQRLTVEQVQASTRIVRPTGGDPLDSPGHFLSVEVALDTPAARTESSLNCHLEQGGGRAEPALMSIPVMPDPGLRHRLQIVFERPDGGLEGAELVCRPFELIVAYSRELRVDLGIDAARAVELEANSSELPVNTLVTTEVLR